MRIIIWQELQPLFRKTHCCGTWSFCFLAKDFGAFTGQITTDLCLKQTPQTGETGYYFFFYGSAKCFIERFSQVNVTCHSICCWSRWNKLLGVCTFIGYETLKLNWWIMLYVQTVRHDIQNRCSISDISDQERKTNAWHVFRMRYMQHVYGVLHSNSTLHKSQCFQHYSIQLNY